MGSRLGPRSRKFWYFKGPKQIADMRSMQTQCVSHCSLSTSFLTIADLGEFPQTVAAYLGDSLPKFSPEEWQLIKGSSDFFGWNHYGTQLASGKRLETDNPRLVSFGSVERVFERDGKPIGNKGEAGHPYDGEVSDLSMHQG